MDELRELVRVERDADRLEQRAAAAETQAAEFSNKLAGLRERLDDMVLQVAVIQTGLEAGEVEEAQAELQDLWLILNSVDRRVKDLLQ